MNMNKGGLKAKLIENLKLPQNTTFKKIGTESAYGVVYEIVGTNRVLKVMRFVNKNDNKPGTDFSKEVAVGRMDDIGHVGTKIYQAAFFDHDITNAHGDYDTEYIGAYVMDNIISRREKANGCTVTTLFKYYVDHYKPLTNACQKSEVSDMYAKLLFDFYKITKGWHADLHSKNIQVVLKKDKTLKRMVVIDYGSHVDFNNKRRLADAKCLDEILDHVQENYNKHKGKKVIYWGPLFPHKNKVRGSKRGQSVVSNASFLRQGVQEKEQPLYASVMRRGHHKEDLNITMKTRLNVSNVRRKKNKAYRNKPPSPPKSRSFSFPKLNSPPSPPSPPKSHSFSFQKLNSPPRSFSFPSPIIVNLRLAPSKRTKPSPRKSKKPSTPR